MAACDSEGQLGAQKLGHPIVKLLMDLSEAFDSAIVKGPWIFTGLRPGAGAPRDTAHGRHGAPYHQRSFGVNSQAAVTFDCHRWPTKMAAWRPDLQPAVLQKLLCFEPPCGPPLAGLRSHESSTDAQADEVDDMRDAY